MLIRITSHVAVDADSVVSIALLQDDLTICLHLVDHEPALYALPCVAGTHPREVFANIVEAINTARRANTDLGEGFEGLTAHAFDSYVANPFHGYVEPKLSEADNFIMEMAAQKGGEFIDDDISVIAFKSIDFINIIREFQKSSAPTANEFEEDDDDLPQD